MAVVADDNHPYYCNSDSYCSKHYTGTVCVPVYNYGVSKCTPNTLKRPVCRGAQPGLCPSYQSSDRGYLNGHCVFVPEDYLSSSNTSSGSGRRLHTSAGSTSTSSTSSSSSKTSSNSDSSTVSTTINSSDGDSTYTVKINKDTVTGQFVCVQLSDCKNLAADTSTCYPSACGSSESQEQCNYQGSCTYKNKAKVTKRSCMCYAGFEGGKCETEVSGACDVDCGTGGDCVDSECVCKEGFDGREYSGKKGNASERCTRSPANTTTPVTLARGNATALLATAGTGAAPSKTRARFVRTAASATANYFQTDRRLATVRRVARAARCAI